MICRAPALSTNATDVSIGLLMDNVTDLLDLNVTLTLHPDPLFATDFTDELRPGDIEDLTFSVMITVLLHIIHIFHRVGAFISKLNKLLLTWIRSLVLLRIILKLYVFLVFIILL